MRRKAVSVIVLTLLLASMLTLAFKVEVISALDYPAIYVDPPSIIDPTLTSGKNFTVSIKTDYNGSDIQAFQFTLSYNASILHGVNVTNGDLIPDIHPSTRFMPGTFNNTEGKLSLTGTILFFISEPAPLAPGPGTLANVTFTVVGYGTSNITLGPETKLIGYTGGGYGDPYDILYAQMMPDHIGHGYFSNVDGGGDVAVTDVIQWFKDPPVTDEAYHTWPVNVNVTLENVNCRTVNVSVSVYYDTIVMGTQTVTDLLSGETRVLTIICDLTSLDPGRHPGVYYTLKANATTIDLPDVNLANNEFAYGTVKIRRWRDVDNSDTITILDLKKVKLAYSGWIDEPFADLDGNCQVNILDVKLAKMIYHIPL